MKLIGCCVWHISYFMISRLKFLTELCFENAENGKETTNYAKITDIYFERDILTLIQLMIYLSCTMPFARDSNGSATPRQDSLTLSNKELHSPSVSLKYKAVH